MDRTSDQPGDATASPRNRPWLAHISNLHVDEHRVDLARLKETRNGLIVDVEGTQASGTAEREATLWDAPHA